MTLKTTIGEPVRQLLRRQGWTVEKWNLAHAADLRRAALLQSMRIETVLDVGANIGYYGHRLRGNGYRNQIESFEPLSSAYAALAQRAASDPRWTTHNVALGDEDGTAELNVSIKPTWSSFMPRDPNAQAQELAYTGAETVSVCRLDTLLPQLHPGEMWVKLDVQGFEMKVLAGAEELLKVARAIECELIIEAAYSGQPSVREMINYLGDRGFEMVSVANGDVRDTGRSVWIDGIFVRD